MKYKCKDCEHVFESNQTVFECPQCGGTNIIEVGNPITKYKKPIIVISIIIAILLLIKLIDGDGTKVNVDYNQQSQRLEVELEGEEINQYNIIVTRDGSVFSTKKYKDKLINFIFDVPGEYRLQVKFIGKGKMPEISKYDKGPWIIEPPKPGDKPIGIQTPQILEVKIQNTNIKLKIYSVKVITDTKAVPLSDTEFSIDNSNYLSSDVFNDLKPGLYTFYVRNAQDQTLINQFQFNLPPIVGPPSDADLNDLLRRIANGDSNAFDKWRIEVDGAQPKPVIGVQFISNSYELAQDAITQNKVYTVHTKRDVNNKIVKIIVN